MVSPEERFTAEQALDHAWLKVLSKFLFWVLSHMLIYFL
jgi:hypothetical protein